MKEAFCAVLTGLQGLGSDDTRERPVDRLASLGAIQIARSRAAERQAQLAGLGVHLIAFKFSHRVSSKADAEDRLCLVLGWETGGKSTWGICLSGSKRLVVAKQAVIEFAIDVCPTCKGAGEIPDGKGVQGAQPMKLCPAVPYGCGGTGKRRYNDQERLSAMGGRFDKALSVAHGIIGRAESLAVEQAKKMLERY